MTVFYHNYVYTPVLMECSETLMKKMIISDVGVWLFFIPLLLGGVFVFNLTQCPR